MFSVWTSLKNCRLVEFKIPYSSYKADAFNHFPNDKILDPSKLKEIADDKLKFDENGGKFSKLVENTAGKGEIARYEQFLPFPQCFQKTCTADT